MEPLMDFFAIIGILTVALWVLFLAGIIATVVSVKIRCLRSHDWIKGDVVDVCDRCGKTR